MASERGSYGIQACVSQDSVIVDTFTEVDSTFSALPSSPSQEMVLRAPSIAFTHVFPGEVQTDFTRNFKMAWHFLFISLHYHGCVVCKMLLYLLAHPEVCAATLQVRLWNEDAEEVTARGEKGYGITEDGNRKRYGSICWSG
jgi:hypothetical protein